MHYAAYLQSDNGLRTLWLWKSWIFIMIDVRLEIRISNWTFFDGTTLCSDYAAVFPCYPKWTWRLVYNAVLSGYGYEDTTTGTKASHKDRGTTSYKYDAWCLVCGRKGGWWDTSYSTFRRQTGLHMRYWGQYHHNYTLILHKYSAKSNAIIIEFWQLAR